MYKAVSEEQKKPGGLPVGDEPLAAYRIPKIFNLRLDPYERADVVSDQYNDWRAKNAYLMGWMNLKAIAFLQTFKDYPPSRIPASFTVDQVQKNIEDTIEALKKKTTTEWRRRSATAPSGRAMRARSIGVIECCGRRAPRAACRRKLKA
jgi:hypothetical protein